MSLALESDTCCSTPPLASQSTLFDLDRHTTPCVPSGDLIVLEQQFLSPVASIVTTPTTSVALVTVPDLNRYTHSRHLYFPQGDTLIASSDRVLYRLDRVFVCHAASRFEAVVNDQVSDDGVVQLEESSHVLEQLLSFAYPKLTIDVGTLSFDELIVLGDAAFKYRFHQASHVVALLMRKLLKSMATVMKQAYDTHSGSEDSVSLQKDLQRQVLLMYEYGVRVSDLTLARTAACFCWQIDFVNATCLIEEKKAWRSLSCFSVYRSAILDRVVQHFLDDPIDPDTTAKHHKQIRTKLAPKLLTALEVKFGYGIPDLFDQLQFCKGDSGCSPCQYISQMEFCIPWNVLDPCSIKVARVVYQRQVQYVQ